MLDDRDFPLVLPADVELVDANGTPSQAFTDYQERQRYWLLSTKKEQQAAIEENTADIAGLDALTISLQSQVDANAAAIIIEANTRATADSAEATLRIALEASTASSFASVATQFTAQAGINSAVASQITTLQAQVGTNSADIYNESVARANADSAIAYNLSVVSTTVSGHTSTLAVYGASINGVEVKFGVQGYISGTTGGFVFTGILKNDGSVAYDVEFYANARFHGNVVIDGSLTTGKLEPNAVSYVDQNTGKAGYFQLDCSFTTQGGQIIMIASVNETEGTVYTMTTGTGLVQRAFPLLIDGGTFAYLYCNDAVCGFVYGGGSAYGFNGIVMPATATYRLAPGAGSHTFSITNPLAQAVRLNLVVIELKR